MVYGDKRGIKEEVYAGRVSLHSDSVVTENTLFDIQSISKVVATCPVLLKRNEQGVFELNAQLSQWFPQFHEGEKSKVTLEHLARYTAGFSDYDLSFAFKSVDEEWEKMLRSPIHSTPGTKVDYADLSYRILGRAIEACTGESLAQLAKRLIWNPLGMSHTCYNPSPQVYKEIASTSAPKGVVDDKEDAFLGGVVGCDGVFSTGRDLAAFCQMILNSGKSVSGNVLSNSSIEHMLAPTLAKTQEETNS